MRLLALEEGAETAGLKCGQGLAEARAICPNLIVIEEDPAADRRFLEALGDWCDRYTPLVGLDGADGLFLDITGCAHLFGGEEAMLKDILTRLTQMGMAVQGAISGSPGLSSALARFDANRIVGDGETETVLAPLPVTALRLDDSTVQALHKVGLKQVGDLMEAPRAPLARRFGPRLLLRLDQARGEDEEAISPRGPSHSCRRNVDWQNPSWPKTTSWHSPRRWRMPYSPAWRHGVQADACSTWFCSVLMARSST